MMDGSTKILTVSYGTFSCTLEGFDDPLGAMRDIAEYFRDLAADDRYFGAEPPTPDVEMLQNIAGKEVNRRVEARMSDSGVALRQVEHDAVDDVERSTDSQDEVPDAVQSAQTDEAAARKDAGALAARVVSAARTEEAAISDEKDTEAEAETTPDVADAGTGPLTLSDELLMSDEPEDVLAIDPSARILDATPAETVAEKLRRIRAVVSKNLETTGETTGDDLVEDIPEDTAARRDRALTKTIEAITADIADDEGDEDAVQQTDAADAHKEDVSEDAADIPEGKGGSEEEPSDKAIDAAARDTSQPLWVTDEDEDENADKSDLLESASEQDDDVANSGEDNVEDDVAAEATEDAKAPTDGESDTPTSEEDEDDNESSRSIANIIGNVSGRLAEADAEDDIELSEPEAAEPIEKRDRKITAPISEDQDGDVGRLLAETDTKLQEDEVVRRRRVISQMRAAVAATKADRLVSRHVSREVVEQEEQSPYREDLSEAVRENPDSKTQVERTAPSSPPLVLVSSQRVSEAIDAFEEVPAETPQIQATNFAEFATNMGAKELPELLEAAAAFTVFGEGQSSFTRPEIMKRVAAVDPMIRMSREESLRSFGQLLRQGKFRKLERGQFTIDQDTRFNPKHRVAG